MDLQSGYPFSLIRYGLPYSYPKLTGPLRADVVIVGGGISGALTGYHLTEAGMGCVIVDGRTIGLGSTCASTSLLQYEIDVSLSELIHKIGRRDAHRSYALCYDSITKLGVIAGKIGLREFEYSKSLYYAAAKKHVPFLKHEFETRKSAGFNVDYLEESSLREGFGFSAPGAILSHHGAQADAYMFTHALYQHCIKRGMQVYDRTVIRNVRHHKKGVTLKTADGLRIDARQVVYATGYEATALIRKKIVKLQSTYATISENMTPPSLIPVRGVMIWNTAAPYLYMRSTDDARILVGGRDEKFYSPAKRDQLIAAKSKLLVRDFKKLFPTVTFKPEFTWTGTFGSTVDGLPFIGQYPQLQHGYFALGFGGNGITFSLIAAEILTDLFLGKKNGDARIFGFERV